MTAYPPDRLAGVTRVIRILAGATVFFGVVCLLGWALQSQALKTGFSRGWPLNPTEALLFVLAAVSLWILTFPSPTRRQSRLGNAAAWLVVLVSLARMLEVWFKWGDRLDLLLFAKAVSSDPVGAGVRMNAGVAMIVGLIGVALLLAPRAETLWRLTGRALGIFVSVLAGIAVLGYVSRRGALAANETTVPASLNGVLGFLFLSVGIWLASGLSDATRATESTDVLRKRVRLTFGVALAILLLAASVSIWSSVRSAEAAKQRKAGFVWRVELTRLLSSVRDAETGQRGYLLTSDSSQLSTFRTAHDSIPVQLKRVSDLAVQDTSEVRNMTTLDRVVRAKAAELNATVDLANSARPDSALRIVRHGAGIVLMDSIKTQVGLMLGKKEQQVAVWDQRLEQDGRVSVFANVVAGLIAVTFLSLAAMTISRDLARRGRAESAVRESERRLAQIIELIPNMVFLKEPKDLRFVHFNKAGEELVGFGREMLIGKNDFDFFPEAEARQFVAKDREVLATREVVDIPEETIHTKDRGVRILHTKKVTVRDERGDPLFLLGISEDVTERKQADRAIREAKEAAEQANRAKSGFLAKMSHELRTPLNSIIGFSEILEEESVGPLTDKQRRYVGNVLLSGRNLLQLINDILDLSKVEAGRMELIFTSFDVARAFEEVRGVVSALADKKKQTITIKVENGVPPVVADRAKFAQMLYNLVGNAIKFTPVGGRIELKARLAWREQDGGEVETVEILVVDNGIGIAQDDLQRIFSEFEQVAKPGPQESGTGLGLALTRKLVELHGGSIDVESTVGTGSTFRLKLPIRKQPAPLDPSVPVTRNGFGPLALVVDDENYARDLLAHYLTSAGYRVASSSGGRDAVQAAMKVAPDVITLDIMMPDRDGFATLAELKSNPATQEIPVVIVSISDQKELGFSLGAADWLVKPVQRGDLLSALHRTAGGHASGGVLVIDDDPSTLEYMQDLLRQQGYDVAVAPGGRQGVELAQSRRPALVILDLVMPDMTGFDVVRELRRRSETANIPILILTAKELSAAEREQLRVSVQAIVPKGGRETLLAELARICPAPVGAHGGNPVP